jgi:hypothetical protein
LLDDIRQRDRFVLKSLPEPFKGFLDGQDVRVETDSRCAPVQTVVLRYKEIDCLSVDSC